MKTANVFKLKPLMEVEIAGDAYYVVVPIQQLSYFTKTMKARLKLETTYQLYLITFDGEPDPCDVSWIETFTRKSEALKACKTKSAEALEWSNKIAAVAS